MLRGAPGIRVLGLVFLLFSLFEPLTLASTFAEPDPPPPDAALLEGTPGSEPVPEPTIAPTEPAPEPTAEPTLPPAPEPTLPPTEVPTVEPTIAPTIPPTEAPEPTIAPTEDPAMEDGDEAGVQTASSQSMSQTGQLEISIQPDAPKVISSEAIGFTITLTNSGETTIEYINLHGAGVPASWSMRAFTGNDASCGIGPTSDIGLWCLFDLSSEEMPLAPGSSLIVSFAGTAPNCSPFSISPYAQWHDAEGNDGRPSVPASVDVECVPEIGIDLSGTTETWHNQFGAYEITVSNTGMAASGDVHFVGTLPGPTANWVTGELPGMSGCDLTPDGEGNTALSCVTNPIPIGGKATAQFSTTFSPSSELCGTTFVAQVTLVTGGTGSDQVSFPAMCPSGYLSLDVDQGDSNVLRGQMMDLTFRLTNTGYTGIHDAYLWVGNLPETWTINESPGSPWCSLTGGFLICNANTENAESFPLGHQDAFEVSISGLASTCGNWTIPIETFSHSVEESETLFFHVHCPSPDPGIQVTTSVAPTAGHIGDEVTFTYTVRNSGNVPLTNIAITDPLSGEVADCAREMLPALAAPYSCTRTYTIDADDVVDGQVASEAAVSAFHEETESTGSAGPVTIDVLSSISISAVADEEQMHFGGVPGFTITVTNEGSAPVTGIAFEGDLPYHSSLLWELRSQFGQCDIYQAPALLECAGIDLKPGDNFEVHATAQRGYSAGCDRTLESTVRLTSGGEGEATASVSVVCPDPVVTVELDDDVVIAGDDIGLTVTISNLVPASYGIYYELPERRVSGIDFGRNYCEEGSHCRFNAIGDYPISRTEYLEGRTYSWGCGTHEFSTVISDPVYRRGTATLTILCPEPGITITSSVEPATGRIGDEVTLTYEITNTGNVPLSDVTVTEDVLGDVAACTLDTLPASGEDGDHITTCSGAYTIDAEDVVDGQVTSSATVNAMFDGTTVSDTSGDVIVDVLPSISISKVADEEQMHFGGVPGFTITVTNEGSAPVTGIAFEDYLPYRGGLPWELRSQFQNCVLDLNNDELLECSGIDLGPGDDFEVRVTSAYGYSAVCDTTLESTARLTQGGEGEAAAHIYVVCPDLAITVLPDADEVIAGNDLGVTIRISNTSSFEADPVTIIGQLPVAFGLEWSTADFRCYIAPTAELDCHYVTIPANGSLDVRFTSPTTNASCGEHLLSAGIDHPYPISADHLATITILCVDPVLPAITQAACVEGEFTAPDIELAETDHITYSLDPASGWAAGDTVTVIATLDEGFGWPAQTPDGWHPVPDAPSQVYREIQLEIPGCPSIEIIRTIEPGFARIGDEVTLTFEVTNTGEVPLEDVYVSDYLLGSGISSCSLDVLPAEGDGDHVHRCTATRTVTEDKVRGNGEFRSSWANVRALHEGAEVYAETGPFGIPIESANPVTISTDTETVIAGGKIGFTITVDESISDIVLSSDITSTGQIDDWIITSDGSENCRLTPNDDPLRQSLACEWEETTTPRTATVRVTAPSTLDSCGTVELETMALVNHAQQDLDPVTISVLCPELSFELSSEPISGTEVREGDEIAYTLTTTNTGEVPLANVTVETDIAGLADEPIGDLGVNGSVMLTASHTVTASDVAAEHVTRSASATGEASTGVGTAPVDPLTLTHTVVQEPSIGLAMDAALQAPTDAHPLGTIDYTLTVTNTGDSTLTGIAITAPLLDEDPIPVADLGPGRDAIIDITYALTQANIDAGHVTNEASVSGMPPTGPSGVREYASISTTIPQHPSLMLTKQVTGVTSGNEARELDPTVPVIGLQPGDIVTYTLVATNTGNVTLHEVAMTDEMLGDLACDEAREVGPNASITCTGNYPLTQDDIDAGEPLVNTASATGVPPQGDPVPAEASVTVYPEVQRPALALTMTASVDHGGSGTLADAPAPIADLDADETVTVTVVIANAGNTTLHAVELDVPLLDDLACEDPGSLGPGGMVRCTGSVSITQADIDAGEPIVISATATSDLTNPVEASVTLGLVAPAPAITLTMTASEAANVGDVVTWVMTAANTGNVTLTDVAMFSDVAGDLTCDGETTLARGDTLTCTATSIVTQDDIDAGAVTSEASVAGMPPTGPSGVREYASATVELAQDPGLTVVLTTDADEVAEGDELTFTFEVANTGNVTIREIAITATLADLVWSNEAAVRTGVLTFAQVDTGGIVGDLAPGETRTLTATYTVTGVDVARGEISIIATVTGIGPEGEITATADPVTISVAVPAPTPEPTVPPTDEPTPEPTVSPTPESTAPPTAAPEGTTITPATPAPAGTTISVSSLPNVGSGPGGQTSMLMIGLLAAGIVAAAGVIVMRKRGMV